MNDVRLSFDPSAIAKMGDQVARRYLTAGTSAIVDTTKDLERKLEAATQAGTPGRLWRAWASDAYPRRGPARNPAGVIYLNGGARTRGAIQFWTEPGAVRGKRGQYLAIPLPAAGSRGRARDLTPGEWERAHGVRLRFVYRPGRASLLVADNAVLSGRAQVARKNTDRRIAAGRRSATVPIFVLLPMVRHRGSVAIDPIIAESGGALAAAFFEAVRSIS